MADSLQALLAGHSAAAPAIGAPDRPWLTHGGLRDLSKATLKRLDGLGIGPTHRVAIVLPNGPEMAAVFLTMAQGAVTAPLNPAFGSLNLAQAVLLIGYEWFAAADGTPERRLDAGAAELAAKADMIMFFERLEAMLDQSGFLFPPEKRPTMVRNIRNLFQRAGLTEQEVRTLHGVVSALIRRDGED